eukprot:15452350-Heterocapsa_arctica.AAC.1
MLFNPEAVEGVGKVWDQEISRTDRQGEEDKGRGKHARGPVAVVIATLSELGWQERGPDKCIIEGHEYDL